jgi:hypothetical protein
MTLSSVTALWTGGNVSYQIVIDGSSYREKLSPPRRKEVLKGVKGSNTTSIILRAGQRM